MSIYESKEKSKEMYLMFCNNIKDYEKDLYENIEEIYYEISSESDNYSYVANLTIECISLATKIKRTKLKKETVFSELSSGLYESYYNNIAVTKDSNDNEIIEVNFKDKNNISYYAKLLKVPKYSYGYIYINMIWKIIKNSYILNNI